MAFKTKQGAHGTLYLYAVPYRDFDPDGDRGTVRIWAYDAEHAVEKFYDSPDGDTGWEVSGQPTRVKANQGKSRAKTVAIRIWIGSEPARGGRTARMFCIDPEDTEVKRKLFEYYHIPMTFFGDPLVVGSPHARFSQFVVKTLGLTEVNEQELWNLGATLRVRVPLDRLKQIVHAA